MVAQAIAENAPYDVILMDYVMPVMDGPTATEEIRRLGFKGVILGVTGNGHQPEIELFVKAGADKVLIKPLSADQFYGTLLGKIHYLMPFTLTLIPSDGADSLLPTYSLSTDMLT
jgi:CheY-like chemotaxis protein